jgi:hypothetical protein
MKKISPDGRLRKATADDKRQYPWVEQVYVTGCGEELFNPHPEQPECALGCVVHHPSQHSMRTFPTHWRGSLMERTCPHGVGHPDPDQIGYFRREFGFELAQTESVHGCDGCCGALSPGAKEATPEDIERIERAKHGGWLTAEEEATYAKKVASQGSKMGSSNAGWP